MVVHAHPDDEVFRTGGIMAKYAAAGHRVIAVYATRGECGEMHDPDLSAEDALPRLGEIREREVRRACAVFGVHELHFLGYRDSGMRDSDDNKRPDAFCNVPVDEAGARLAAVMRETRPQVVVTYDEFGEKGYEHPDHVMVNRVTVAAFNSLLGEPGSPEKLYYGGRSREGFRQQVEGLRTLGLSIPWLKGDFNFDEFGVPDSEITAHIDIRNVAHLKKQALAAHRTQIPPDFYYFAVPDEAFTEFMGVEHFERIYPAPQPGEQEDDLFEGISDSAAAA